MNNTEQMTLLLEAVDGTPKVDSPKSGYANTPNEQTLDSATQQNFGNDLNKKKSYQHPSRDGDNPRASAMTEYKLKEEKRLTAAFERFKLNESVSIDTKWSSDRELAKILQTMIKNDDDLEYNVGKPEFDKAHFDMMAGDASAAADNLLSRVTTGDDHARNDFHIIRNEIIDALEGILANRQEEAFETAGSSEGESATLKKLHHAGVNKMDGVKAKVMGPTDEYPAPWSAEHVGGKYQIYAVKASNRAEVATWMTKEQAEQVVSEVN